MYPLPAVLVNCPDSFGTELRAGLAENGVRINTEFPSVEKALASPPFLREAEKSLFVVRVRSLEETRAIGRLDSAFPGCPVLALIEGDYDAASLFRVNRAGAAQLLPVPLIRSDLGAALDRVLTQFALQQTASRVIAVGGVTEGVGATTLAIELATEIAALGAPLCVLTELPHGVGRLAGLLNIEPPTTTADILRQPGKATLPELQAALTPITDRMSVLVAPYNALASGHPGPGALPQFIRLLRQVASFVVIDMPSSFDAEHFEILSLVDDLVLVARQDVPSVQAAQLVVGGLRERGLPDPTLLLNMYESDRDAFSTKRIAELLELRRVFPVHADLTGIRAAANRGEPLAAIHPKSDTVRDLHPVAKQLLHTAGVPVHEDRRTLWGWFRERFGRGSK